MILCCDVSLQASYEKMVTDLSRAEEATLESRKRKREGGAGQRRGAKQQKLPDVKEEAPGAPEQASASAPATAAPVPKEAAAEQQEGDGKAFQVLALPSAEARGHTGYLTFARRLVVPPDAHAATSTGPGENGTDLKDM